MKINRIVLKNFLSHRDTTFDISDINPVIVVGDNGAGKSTLVKDSITWALFGKARGSGDELITEGESNCLVSVDFDIDGEWYRVVRTRSREKKTELLLEQRTTQAYVGGGSQVAVAHLEGAVIAETQAKIEELLGMDYDTFTRSACVEQGEADSFSALAPKEAKQTIMRILGLSVYDTYLERVRETLRSRKMFQEVLERDLMHYQTTLRQYDGANFDLTVEAKRLAALEQQYRLILDSIALVEFDLKTLREAHTQIAAETSRNGSELAAATSLRTKLTARLAKLVSPNTKNCPLCLSPIDEAHLHGVVDTYEKEIAKQDKLIQKLTSEKERLTEAWKLNGHLLIVKDGERMAVQGETAKLTVAIQEAKLSLELVEGKRKAFEQMAGLVRDTETKLLQDKEVTKQYGLLEKAFGKDGIPALVVENALPEIEAGANEILVLLSDHTMQVEFTTQKALKTGGIGETLEIVTRTRGNAVPYDNLSGGEKFRVDLAVRIALSRTLARRSNFKCGTMIIDEGFGSLDAGGRQRFVELSRMLQGTFDRLIIVTHTDLTEVYDNLIRVEKVNGASRVMGIIDG